MLKDINAFLRMFLWAGVEMRRNGNAAKVGWTDVWLPKREGGLGAPNVFHYNRANTTKHLCVLSRKGLLMD